MSATVTRRGRQRREGLRRRALHAAVAIAAVTALGISARGLSFAPRPLSAEQVPAGPAQVRTVIPAIQMGTAAIDLSTPSGEPHAETLLTGRSGIPLRYRPAVVSVAPGSGMSKAETTRMVEAAGLRVEYRAGISCGSKVRWGLRLSAATLGSSPSPSPSPSPSSTQDLPPDTSHRLCLSIVSSQPQAQLISAFAGRSLTVHTRIDSLTPAPSSWTAATIWTVPYAVSLPGATAPEGAPACTRTEKRSATIHWAWPSETAKPAKGAIQRWTILAKPAAGGADWTLLASTTGGSSDRFEHLYTAAFRGAKLPAGEYDIAVRGYPFAKDATRYVDSASTWRVKVPAQGAPTCGPVSRNTGPLVVGFGG